MDKRQERLPSNSVYQRRTLHFFVRSLLSLVSQASSSNDFERYVKLADFRRTLSADLSYAKEGNPIEAPVWRSPEITLDIPLGSPPDTWSFGTMVRRSLTASLTFPRVLTDLSGYRLPVLSLEAITMFPNPRTTTFPPNTPCTPSRSSPSTSTSSAPSRICTESCWLKQRVNVVAHLTPFVEKEMSCRQANGWHMPHKTGRMLPKDQAFFSRIMKMDPREKHTAKGLLKDEWLND